MLYQENESVTILKKIVNIGSWIILTSSFFLTGVVAVAQVSVPGDLTYPVKLAFEKSVLVGYKLFNLDSRYQIDLTELRFAETKKIIKSNRASLGFDNLIKQIIATEYSIYNVKDPKKKVDLANQYIATLTNISYQLEQEKQTTSVPSPISTRQSPTTIPPIVIENQTNNVNNQINYTQDQIQEMINRLNQLTEEAQLYLPTPTPTTTSDDTAVQPPQPTSAFPTLIPTIPLPAGVGKKPNNDEVTPTIKPTDSSQLPISTVAPTSNPTLPPAN